MTLEVMSPTAALLDGRYILHDRVGRGGMATVYRADDTHLERTVAIKMIHEGDGPVSSIERAHTEKALLASLSHPSLVTLHDAQLEPRRPQYLVMEFVDGPTLAQRMAAGPLPPREVARFTRDLAEGLTAVHAAGIVHRDVKPSNVLLARGRAGRPFAAKLADFGIACSIENTRLTTPGIVLGTLTYMAPEQLRDADPGTPVDIFSLGLVALEALTGSPGYATLASGRAAAIARLMNPPTISETVPEEWRDLLTRMTRLEPEERPTAVEVARAARGLLRDYASDSGAAVPAAVASVVAADGDGAASADSVGSVMPVGSAAPAVSASPAGAGDEATDAAASTPRTDRTAVLPAVDADDRAPRSNRRRMLFGAAGLAATGALVVGLAAFTSPGAADLSRVSTAVVRAPEVSADTTEDAPAAPVEVVTEPVDNPGNSDKSGKGNPGSGNSGKGNPDSGNSGNSGKGNPDKGNSGNGKGDKGKG
ncbi:serine/threonine-protein kinase [Microbacterium hydrocarbonoxydans]|uniref:non-specific serine/threonine protein kinase n=1 Tax=Microbacterium hydrocarbonoxydans TaxID=273678 RepID=A0A1H4IQT8_9MICO|nr:serine/threonine-protein kinase [Microbacterium hydrocarbonoxydans]SEB36343.1 Serine/threonine protein kinase [Microbacterium hydrocarbonoxydans]